MAERKWTQRPAQVNSFWNAWRGTIRPLSSARYSKRLIIMRQRLDSVDKDWSRFLKEHKFKTKES